MPRGKTSGGKPTKRPIERYEHTDKKRINNPPVGLVTPETDPVSPTHKIYDYVAPVPSVKPRQELDYDPHLDPQLVWAGKKEHSSFEVPTVSLHVHERIDPHTIIEAVRKRNGTGLPVQPSLFESREENPPLREAIDFYRHAHGWSNRLIAGDSLLVMNSLLEKEGMAGQVQMVYLDPPYGVRYGSNFQPFVNQREVKDGKDEDLTQEPEMIRAFRDTWELGIHSYLSYLRDRLLLARDLLHQTGSCFVQISDENLHHVRELMDEVFGANNFCAVIAFQKTAAVSSPQARTNVIGTLCDYVVWYAKRLREIKYRQLYLDKGIGVGAGRRLPNVDSPDGTRRQIGKEEIDDPSRLPQGARVFQATSLQSAGFSETELSQPFEFRGSPFRPADNAHWKTTQEGLRCLSIADRIARIRSVDQIRALRGRFPGCPLTRNVWMNVMGASEPDLCGPNESKSYPALRAHGQRSRRPSTRPYLWFGNDSACCRAVGTPLDHLRYFSSRCYAGEAAPDGRPFRLL